MINYTLSKTVAADYTSFTALAAALTGAPPDDDVTVTCLDTAIYDEENVDFMDALVAGRKLTIIGKIHPNGSRTTIRNTTMTGTILTRQHCIFWMNGTIDISGLKFDNSMTYDYKDKVSTCLYIDAPTCPYSKIHKCVFLGSGHYYGSGTPNWYEFGTEAVHWAGSPPATEYKYFHDNHVDRMGLYGLQLIGKTEAHIYNNTFTRNHMSIGWWTAATAGSKIWNNIFVEDPSYFTVDASYVENIAAIQAIQRTHLSAFGLVDYNVYHCFNRPTGAQKVFFFDRRDAFQYETLAAIQIAYQTVITERQPAGNANRNWKAVASDDDGSNLIAGNSLRLYTSSNSGVGWTQRQPAGNVDRNWVGVASDSDGSHLIAAALNARLYTSADSGANWTERRPHGADENRAWIPVASDADGSHLMAAVYMGRLYTSADSGVNWTERRPAGDADKDWYGTASDSDGSHLIAGVAIGRLYTSADSGANWTERRPHGLDENRYWRAVASDADGSHLIAAAYLGRLYTSADGGANWTERRPAGDANKDWQTCASDSDGSHLVAAVYGGRIYASSDYGVNWVERQPVGNLNRDWISVASDSDGSNLYVAILALRTYTIVDAGAATIEVNGLEANPKLSNYPGYRLDLSSPAIDMASDDHSGIDIDNKTRPEESGDVGCFEYAGRKRGPLPMFFR